MAAMIESSLARFTPNPISGMLCVVIHSSLFGGGKLDWFLPATSSLNIMGVGIHG